MHVDLGGYHISGHDFSAAFDVAARRLGCDSREAIGGEPNNTFVFARVPRAG